MIPKYIHYCWFGKNEKPKEVLCCIKSWEKYCRDYQIIEWNEENYPISDKPLYVKQAFDLQKWAFVSDYARLDIVNTYGGLYLDTDVELIKNVDELLECKGFFGFETAQHVATGLGFGSEANQQILIDLMKPYYDIPFLFPDGTIDDTTCVIRNNHVFQQYGLVQNGKKQILSNGMLIYPPEYFAPISPETGRSHITTKTYSIHHYAASWMSDQERNELEKIKKRIRQDRIIHAPNRLLKRVLGEKGYERIKKII